MRGRPVVDIGGYLAGAYEVAGTAHGGMGWVYLVEDLAAKKKGILLRYALKTVLDYGPWVLHRRQRKRKDLGREIYDGQVDRFRQESERWVSLGSHTNLINAIAVINLEGKPYLILEYAEGGSLAERIQAQRVAVQEVVEWSLQVCNGLEFVHQHGVIHCDIKPGNILFGRDQAVKITDLGLAVVMFETPHSAPSVMPHKLTPERRMGIGGTPAYSPPEQFEGYVDERSDIFAYGATMFEMLLGNSPFAESPSVDMQNSGGHVPVVNRVDPSIPSSLSEIIAKCLEFEPSNRFATAADLRTALESIRHSLRQPSREWSSRRESTKWKSFEFRSRVVQADATVFDDRAQFEKVIYSLTALGKYDQAIAAADRAIVADPNYAGHWINRGVACGEAGKSQEAVLSFQQATDLEPRNALAWANLAFAYRSDGRREEGTCAATEAVHLSDKTPEAWHALGCCQLDLGKLHDSIASLERAIALAPHDFRIMFNLAMSQSRCGFDSDAVASFRRTLELNPECVPAYAELALLYAAAGEFGEALSVVGEGLAVQVDDARLWVVHATVLWASGSSPDEAVQSLNRALKIDPERYDALELLSAIRREANQ